MKLRRFMMVSLLIPLAFCCGCNAGGPDSTGNSSTDATVKNTSETIPVDGPAEGFSPQQEPSQLPTDSLEASMPTGDIAPEEDPVEGQVLDVLSPESIDMSVRAKPKSGSLFHNKAKRFYYRENIKPDIRRIYDAIVKLNNDPSDTSKLKVTLQYGHSKEVIGNMVSIARIAVKYDHPEFFWFDNGLEGSIYWWYNSSSKKIKEFSVSLSKPYRNYKKEMTAFNKAVNEFLKGIDTNQSDAAVALAIHDKLIKQITYDQPLLERHAMDYGHTAYGALVDNGHGQKNMAVCDGYSKAYAYLLQQVGIEAIVISGAAGENAKSAGSHAWNLVKLGNDWYEVDATWDDTDLTKVARDYEKKYPGDYFVPIFWEAARDANYTKKVTHYLYNVTTAQISNYVPGNELNYYRGNSWIWVKGPSVHIRYNKKTQPASEYSINVHKVINLAPKAYGARYAYGSSLKSKSSQTSPATECVLPDSEAREYSRDELEGLSTYQLFLARNEIFARHGFDFEMPELKDFFENKEWYEPSASDDTNETDNLSETERQNALTILEIEQERNSPYIETDSEE